MNKLNLNQPLAVVVVGLPGAGKTFFAERFATMFGAPVVSRDRIRWTLFANHTYSDNENAMVNQVADLFINEMWRSKHTFVLDGGYDRHQTRDHLIRLAKKAGFYPLVVEIQSGEPISQDRATHRRAKNPDDKYNQSLSTTQFAKFKNDYEAPRSGQNTVVISGTHTTQAQLRTVLQKIITLEKTATTEEKRVASKNNASGAASKVFIQ